jgi:hypothetical protein
MQGNNNDTPESRENDSPGHNWPDTNKNLGDIAEDDVGDRVEYGDAVTDGGLTPIGLCEGDIERVRNGETVEFTRPEVGLRFELEAEEIEREVAA